MLFNSYTFLFAFLPATLLLTWLAGRRWGDGGVIAVLIVASGVFLAWQSLRDLALLAVSIPVNFGIAALMWRSADNAGRRKAALAFGIVFNVALLTLYKIPAEVWHAGTGEAGSSGTAGTLPLAISFYTFHQIAFLVDHSRQGAAPVSFRRYAMFVSFFPQLIAGPIVRWNQMVSQLHSLGDKMRLGPHTAAGLMLMSVGLAKKVLLADPIGGLIGPIYAAAQSGLTTRGEAFAAAYGFAFQVYFDFSAYSDIAVGAALLFGLYLPVNFLSPFKATNFMEFWTTWHVTLSQFFRDYIYVPLGGRSPSFLIRAGALFVVFLISGVWHGVGWTFIIFGLIHGVLVFVSQVRRRLTGADRMAVPQGLRLWWARWVVVSGFALSLLFFRSPDLATALNLYESLIAGGPGWGQLPHYFVPVLAGLLALTWMFPNTPQIFGQTGELEQRQTRIANLRLPFWWPAFAGLLLGLVLIKMWGISAKSEFIYFAF